MFAIYSSDNAVGRDSKNSEIMASFKTTTPVSALAPFKDFPCRAVAGPKAETSDIKSASGQPARLCAGIDLLVLLLSASRLNP